MSWSNVLRSSVMAMLVSGCFSSVGGATAAATSYEMTIIGNLVGTGNGQFDTYIEVRPIGLNNHGDVVALALSSGSENALMPFTSINGKVRRLGKEALASDVQGMNSAGEIVGTTGPVGAGAADLATTPVVWRDRKAVPLPSLSDGTAFPTSLNEHGVIVGENVSTTYNPTAVIWINDEITDLG